MFCETVLHIHTYIPQKTSLPHLQCTHPKGVDIHSGGHMCNLWNTKEGSELIKQGEREQGDLKQN